MGMCVLFLTICNIPIGQYDIVVHSIILSNMHCTTICKVIFSHKQFCFFLLTLKRGFKKFGCGICEVEMMYFHLDQSQVIIMKKNNGFWEFVGTKRCTSIQNKARHNHNKTNLWDSFLGKQSSSLTKLIRRVKTTK